MMGFGVDTDGQKLVSHWPAAAFSSILIGGKCTLKRG